MAERRNRPSDAELERALAELGAAVQFPPTPPLGTQVAARLTATSPRPPRARLATLRRALAVAALLLVGLAVALLVASPRARTAIAERLGLRGVVIVSLPATPSPTPRPPESAPTSAAAASASPSAAPAATPSSVRPTVPATVTPLPVPGESLGLGRAVTLAAARQQAGFGVLVPAQPDLGAPDAVYFVDFPPGGQVSLVYRPRLGLPDSGNAGVGLLLTEFRGQVEQPLLQKMVGPNTRVQALAVNGGQAFWIEGAPHAFFFRDRNGEVRQETVRLARNVLLWEQGELTVRLESALDRDAALAIAASLR